MVIKLSASILASNLLSLEKEIDYLESLGIDGIHIDIMDGQFVPNLSFGPDIVKAIKNYSELFIDTHLMVQNPENIIDAFIDAKPDMITLHLESTNHILKLIQYIKSKSIMVGLALMPSTSLHMIEYLIDEIDLLLIMSVNPGFCNQQFLSSQVKKIYQASQILSKNKNKNILLGVDGGVNAENINIITQSGAKFLVMGGYLFKHKKLMPKIIDKIKKLH